MEQARVSSNTVSVAYAAHVKGKGKSRDMSTMQCYCCKKYGHIDSHCLQKFYNYYKQSGHIIKECPTHPPCPTMAYHATVNSGALQPLVLVATTITAVALQPLAPSLT